MPRIITAARGDTLCGLAIQHGFHDCAQLRAEGANAALLSRPLRQGDSVTIPDLRPKSVSVPAGSTHRFVLKKRKRPQLRFVHGSPDKPFDQDASLALLNISNYRADKAGAAGTAALPAGFGFNADGHADPDTFKIEVVGEEGGNPRIKLEALKPVYRADGTLERHEPFTGAEANARKLEVDCQLVNGGTDRYRSKYLRLVTDDQDQAAAPTQALLVTDLADGLNGANDRVEILDQVVRASYALPKCPVAEPDKCKVMAELPLGQDRRRIRIALHVFRTAPGAGSPIVGGLTEQMLRRRTMKWFRRAYAQANLSVKLVGPGIEFIDPPAANMLTISQDTGVNATGVDGAGNPSTLSFTIDSPPGTPPPVPPAQNVSVNLAPGMTPAQVGAAILAALPAGYSGQSFTNARAFNVPGSSCDVLVTRNDGTRLILRGETTTDTRLTVMVVRVNLSSVNASDNFNTLIPTTAEFRRVLRSAPGADDRLDFFVIGQFNTPGLRGRAFVPATDLGAAFQPPAPLRWAVVMAATSGSGPVMDGGDNLPFTFPHEAGHVLNDAFHSDNGDPNGPTELMSGTGTSAANSVNATKRISDDPVRVRYAFFDSVQATPGAFKVDGIFPAQRMRTRGAPVTEAW